MTQERDLHNNCCKGARHAKECKKELYGHLFFGTNFKEILGIYLPNISEPLCANWRKSQAKCTQRQKGYLMDTG